MLVLVQSWLVLTGGLLTVLALVIGLQGLHGLLRTARRSAAPAPATPSGRPALRLVQS